MIYRFGLFTLDLEKCELRCGDALRPVEPQVFSLLALLLENRDRVVSKDEIVDVVWKGRIVSDAAISSRVSSARHAVDDNGEAQTLIRTLPRRGFRFVATVETDAPLRDRPLEMSGMEESVTVGGGNEGPSEPAQQIRFCTTDDRVRLAFSTAGTGPTLVKAANWLNHLEYDWTSPVWRDLYLRLTRRCNLVRYDERGTGLSQWDVADISFEAFVDDLETVVDAAGLDRFALFGISQGAAVAIEFAARHPDMVTHLVLWGGFARGRLHRGRDGETARSEAFLTLMRQGWGQENPAFRRMFASLYLPSGTATEIEWWTDLQRVTTSPDNAVRIREAIDDIDVSARLPHIRAPTLVLHSRDEAVVPIDEAQHMAAAISDARFVLLDSSNHLVLPREPAWHRAVTEMLDFLSPGDMPIP